MNRKLISMILVDALLGLLFAYSNYAIWDKVNFWIGAGSGKSHWSAFTVRYDNGMLIWVTETNFPFILFWVLMITNLLFAIWMQRSKEKKPNTA